MGWIQYLWKWVYTATPAPIRTIEFVMVLLTIFGGAIKQKRPAWVGKMDKLAWQIPLGLLLVVFLISMAASSYNLYNQQQVRITDLSQQLDVARKQAYPPITTLMMSNYFRDLDIPLGQFGLVSNRLENKTFENCRIAGPCVIRLGNHNYFADGALEGDLEGSFIVTTNRMTLGTIQLNNDTFLRCIFTNVSFIGSPEEIRNIKSGFRLAKFPRQ